jgi:hypothetical protein
VRCSHVEADQEDSSSPVRTHWIPAFETILIALAQDLSLIVLCKKKLNELIN